MNRHRSFSLGLTLLLSMLLLVSCAGKQISFESSSTYEGKKVNLSGELTKPEGEGPWPAVVLLHGCTGIMDSRQNYWVKELVDDGYVVFQLDSLGPRKIHTPILCEGDGTIPGLDYEIRAQDAYDAKAYLTALPFVDSERIALMGFSNGAIASLVAAKTGVCKQEDPFEAVVTLYPYCFEGAFKGLDTPVMVIVGEKDDWTPARLCRKEYTRKENAADLEHRLEVLPGLYHCFDCVGIRDYQGHRMVFNSAGRKEARQLAGEFLKNHFK